MVSITPGKGIEISVRITILPVLFITGIYFCMQH